jgi:hypothetical protein
VAGGWVAQLTKRLAEASGDFGGRTKWGLVKERVRYPQHFGEGLRTGEAVG